MNLLPDKHPSKDIINKDISKQRTIWDKRIRVALKEKGWSQEDFRDALIENNNELHPTQSTVNRWCNLSKGKNRRFPTYERMCEIGTVLGKSIAWLTGEIDGDDYTEQAAMDYMHLPAQGIRAIIRMTGGANTRNEMFSIVREIADYRIYPIALSRLLATQAFSRYLVPNIIEYLQDYAVVYKSNFRLKSMERADEREKMHDLHRFKMMQLMGAALDEMTEGVNLPSWEQFASEGLIEQMEKDKAQREAEENEFWNRYVKPTEKEMEAEKAESEAANRAYRTLEDRWEEAVHIPLSNNIDDPFEVQTYCML